MSKSKHRRTTWSFRWALLRLSCVGMACSLTACASLAGPSGERSQAPVDSWNIYPAPADDRRDTSVGNRSPSAGRQETASGTASTVSLESLHSALMERLTVWVRHDGERVLSRYCRNSPVPCEQRTEAFAAMFLSAGHQFRLDPLLLAAIALKESNLNPAALGPLGTAGIMQLHPRGVGRGQPFVVNAGYRRRCLTQVDACQREIVFRASEAIARSIEACGSLEGALGRYATGRCTDAVAYRERVMTERERLLGLIHGVDAVAQR